MTSVLLLLPLHLMLQHLFQVVGVNGGCRRLLVLVPPTLPPVPAILLNLTFLFSASYDCSAGEEFWTCMGRRGITPAGGHAGSLPRAPEGQTMPSRLRTAVGVATLPHAPPAYKH